MAYRSLPQLHLWEMSREVFTHRLGLVSYLCLVFIIPFFPLFYFLRMQNYEAGLCHGFCS